MNYLKYIFAMVAIISMRISVMADPPQPLELDFSTSYYAPEVEVYKQNTKTIRVTVNMTNTPVSLTGYTPFMYWSKTPQSASYVPAACAVVSGTTGIFDAVFSSNALSTNGVFIYGAGISNNSGTTLIRQGKFTIIGDPSTGGNAVKFVTPINASMYQWSGAITGLSSITAGIYYGDGSQLTGISGSTNGLASISYVNDASNNLAAMSGGGTNGLASILYVQAATQGLVTASVTNGLASISLLESSTNTLATNRTVDAGTLEGYTASDLSAAGATYYVWGSLAGQLTNPATKLAQLASPVSQPVWTSQVSGATVTNGLMLGYACIKQDESPRLLQAGHAKIHLPITRTGNANLRDMQAFIRIYEADGTLLTTYTGDIQPVLTAGPHLDFDVSITNETIITDSGRFIVFYFRLVSGWGVGGGETITVLSQDGELAYVELSSGGGGVFASQADHNAHTNLSIASGAHGGEIDPIWSAQSNAVRTHTVSAHGVTNSGFSGGASSVSDGGGAAIGQNSVVSNEIGWTEGGGAVGKNARANNGGGAVGQNTFADNGGAIGSGAQTMDNGGAVGALAYSANGGAVGYAAKTGNGFAGGSQAYATDDGASTGNGIDAVQLGTGGNTNPLSLQIYGYPLMQSDGTVPLGRTPYVSAIRTATLEPTGFANPELVTVEHNTNNTITLTQAGGINIWWRGTNHLWASPWTSAAHATNDGKYYLSCNTSTNAEWTENLWSFDKLQIAIVTAKSGTNVATCETHGLMGWQSHREAHLNIGTFRTSGCTPDPTTYAVSPATAADSNNTPGFLVGVIEDEDNPTTIAAWPQDKYTTVHFTSTGVYAFVTNAVSMMRVSNNYPDINVWNGSTFAETETAANRFVNYYQILLPAADDAKSQTYRTLILQPQFAYTSLALAQAEDFRAVYLGELTTLAPEMVAFTRFTMQTAASFSAALGRSKIAGVSYLTGSKATQVSISTLPIFTETDTLALSVIATAQPTWSVSAGTSYYANTSGTGAWSTASGAAGTSYYSHTSGTGVWSTTAGTSYWSTIAGTSAMANAGGNAFTARGTMTVASNVNFYGINATFAGNIVQTNNCVIENNAFDLYLQAPGVGKDIIFRTTNNQVRMRISANGNVTVGTNHLVLGSTTLSEAKVKGYDGLNGLISTNKTISDAKEDSLQDQVDRANRNLMKMSLMVQSQLGWADPFNMDQYVVEDWANTNQINWGAGSNITWGSGYVKWAAPSQGGFSAWETNTTAAAFPGTYIGGNSAQFFRGKLVLLASSAYVGPSVWTASPSDPTNWSQVTSASISSIPGRGASMPTVVHNSKLFLFGGRNGDNSALNDVWYTSDITNWVQATASAGWSDRWGAAAISFRGALWLIGGVLYSGGYTYYTDVWRSDDNGTNWTEVTGYAMPWTAWCAGASGGDTMLVAGICDGRSYNAYPTVTTTDGTNWTQVCEGQFSGDDVTKFVYHAGKYWSGGGQGYSGDHANLMYLDGTNWTDTSTAGWHNRFSGFVSDSTDLFVLSGMEPGGSYAANVLRSVWGAATGGNSSLYLQPIAVTGTPVSVQLLAAVSAPITNIAYTIGCGAVTSTVTLADTGSYPTNTARIVSGIVTNFTSGTNLVVRQTTTNNGSGTNYGVSIQWRYK